MRTGAIIYPLLANNTNLTALVPAASIFAVRAEQPTSTSYIVYREITSIPVNTKGDSTTYVLDPRMRQRAILDINTVQISCFANTYLEVENIAVEVRKALDREWGSVGSTYINDIYIESIVYDSAVDDYDDDYGDRGVYIKHLDFTIRVDRVDQGYFNKYSIFMDGTDQYLNAGNSTLFTPNISGNNYGFSVSYWCKISPPFLEAINFMEKINGSQGKFEWYTGISAKGYPLFKAYSGGTNTATQQWKIETNICNGAWRHIVFAWSLFDGEDGMEVYIDGKRYALGADLFTYTEVGTWVSIGNTDVDLTLGRYFTTPQGVMNSDEVTIWDGQLENNDVIQLYNNGLSGKANEIPYNVGTGSTNNITLTSWWRMGDTEGQGSYPTILDMSDNNNPLTMVNMNSGDIVSEVPTGPFLNKYSLNFDGVDDYLSIPNNSKLSPTVDGFTIMFWVYFPTLPTSKNILNKSSVSLNSEYLLDVNASNKFKIFFYGNLDGSIVQRGTINQAVVAETWYHVAFTFTNTDSTSSIQGYLNGDSKTTNYTSSGVWSPTINGTSPVLMGQSQLGTPGANMILDEVAMFNKPLDENYINSIYNDKSPTDLMNYETFYEDLNGWWRMGDTEGPSTYPTIADASNNSNTATMNNMDSTDITTSVFNT